MSLKKEVDYFTGQLLEKAIKDFKGTEQSRLLKEKLDRMDIDCGTMFTSDQREFAEECFDLPLDFSGAQEEYVYRQGLKDCVFLLKEFGVLA